MFSNKGSDHINKRFGTLMPSCKHSPALLYLKALNAMRKGDNVITSPSRILVRLLQDYQSTGPSPPSEHCMQVNIDARDGGLEMKCV